MRADVLQRRTDGREESSEGLEMHTGMLKVQWDSPEQAVFETRMVGLCSDLVVDKDGSARDAAPTAGVARESVLGGDRRAWVAYDRNTASCTSRPF